MKKIKYLKNEIAKKFILILIFGIIFFYLKKNFLPYFCHNCIGVHNYDLKCYKCSSNLLFKSIKILSNEETLKELLDHRKSIARFGDGEFGIIFGNNLKFQNFNKTLKDKLLFILKENNPDLLVGLIPLYKNTDVFLNNWVKNNKFKLAKIINKHKIYYSTLITRFYDVYKSRSQIKNYVSKFKKIWYNRNILIIEGHQTRLGIGNDLFNNAKSIKRIICPVRNAFNVYKKILYYIKKMNLDKDTLILISLGPTATVLAHDLVKSGNQIIDFGHFDIQYEYYIRNCSKNTRIPYKYVNEVPGGSLNIANVSDINYFGQIIYTIT